MEQTWREKIEGTTEQILAQIRKLVDEGNVRRVRRQAAGKTIAEFPLTVGVVGTVIAPVAAAIGALTAVLADCTIEVEKTAPRRAAAGRRATTSRRSSRARPTCGQRLLRSGRARPPSSALRRLCYSLIDLGGDPR